MGGKSTTWKKGPVTNMDALLTLQMSESTGLKVHALNKIDPTEFEKILETECKVKFDVQVAKNGDVQIFQLPKELVGSDPTSYEIMNFLLFYFNIRKNLEVRVKAHLSAGSS